MSTQKPRIVIGVIYFVILTAICWVFIENPFATIFSTNKDMSIVYFTGALFLILGKYLIEPYFTKPTDVIINSISVILALNSISSRADFLFYGYIYTFALIIFVLGFISIFAKDTNNKIIEKVSTFCYLTATTFGQSKVIFSLVYISAVYSYFLIDLSKNNIILFSLLLLYWIIVALFDVLSIIWNKISLFLAKIKLTKKSIEIGYAIGCENPFLYRIECNTEIFSKENFEDKLILVETSNNVGQLGIVIKIDYLLGKRWLLTYLLKDNDDKYYNINATNFKLIETSKTIFEKKNRAFIFDINDLHDATTQSLLNNYFYKNKNNFIGYITTDSDIYTINISILTNDTHALATISDGAIINCLINGKEVQYQIINGKTKKEHLENYDSFGYTIAVARKLGVYDNGNNELLQARWMPEIYTPVFIYPQEDISEHELKQIAKDSIGRLPKTKLKIPIKDFNAIVTHNTAILGILGIGKSCLTYELIKKLSNEKIKIVCIDITNEYIKELPSYIPETIIKYDDENAFNQINVKYEYIHSEGAAKNPEKSGNKIDYANEIKNDLCDFLFNQNGIPDDKTVNSPLKVRIYNPDYHKVSRGEKIGYNVITTELTQAEKTRIITEEIFKILMKLGVSPDKKARILVVFEEAHSLIPEWNSVSSEGDKTATNGTAKVILQGRKYGLGCFVITQRTANVSKSILNQCNTIFAMRVFDDTGKGFLENYFGNDYTSTLPTLEERNAIVIGKGLKLKQPVILELNNRDYLIQNKTATS